MITMIVGGGENHRSKIVDDMSTLFDICVNGYDSWEYAYESFIRYVQNIIDNHKPDLIVWMLDVPNEYEKLYIKKPLGSVLICSKVLRDNNYFDAVSRIFRMNGNGVIVINKDFNPYSFELIDALGNRWVNSNDFSDIVWKCKELTAFTKTAKRVSLERMSGLMEINKYPDNFCEFLDLNKSIAQKIQVKFKERYFGNLSTRCMKLFPSERAESGFFFSERNVNKEFITIDNMVYVQNNKYYGDKKPSIDTPVQLRLYERYPNVNYMIHGHAYTDIFQYETSNYYLCGDVREAEDVMLFHNFGCIKLSNHGFLIYADTFENLKHYVDITNFEAKQIEDIR